MHTIQLAIPKTISQTKGAFRFPTFKKSS